MTFIVIDLIGDSKETETKEEVKLEPLLEDQRDHQLRQQVINIHGEIVSV